LSRKKKFFSNILNVNDLRYLRKCYHCLISDAEKRPILDQGLRCHVLDIVLSKPSNVYDVCKMWTSFTIELVRNEMCTAVMPVAILSDMFDVNTMDVCEKMFDHVESNVNVLKEPQFFVACKNNLLRMCNGGYLIKIFFFICYDQFRNTYLENITYFQQNCLYKL